MSPGRNEDADVTPGQQQEATSDVTAHPFGTIRSGYVIAGMTPISKETQRDILTSEDAVLKYRDRASIMKNTVHLTSPLSSVKAGTDTVHVNEFFNSVLFECELRGLAHLLYVQEFTKHVLVWNCTLNINELRADENTKQLQPYGDNEMVLLMRAVRATVDPELRATYFHKLKARDGPLVELALIKQYLSIKTSDITLRSRLKHLRVDQFDDCNVSKCAIQVNGIISQLIAQNATTEDTFSEVLQVFKGSGDESIDKIIQHHEGLYLMNMNLTPLQIETRIDEFLSSITQIYCRQQHTWQGRTNYQVNVSHNKNNRNSVYTCKKCGLKHDRTNPNECKTPGSWRKYKNLALAKDGVVGEGKFKSYWCDNCEAWESHRTETCPKIKNVNMTEITQQIAELKLAMANMSQFTKPVVQTATSIFEFDQGLS